MTKKEQLKRRRAAQEESLTYEDLTEAGAAPPQKKVRTEARTSLFVRSLPRSATSESLTTLFSEHFPVKHATVVIDKATQESRGYGFVTFTDSDDCLSAKAKLNGYLIDGRRIQLEVAEPRHRDAKGRAEAPEEAARWEAEKERRKAADEEARKPPKLIIRNLPWSIKKPEDLSKLFLSFGKIKFADLPQSQGKLSGFGFVTLRGRKNAETAIAALNGKEIDGRTIAVDWAVDKETWEKEKAKEIAAEKAVRRAAREAEKEAKKKGKNEDGKDKNKESEEEKTDAEEPKVSKATDDYDPDADIAAFMDKMEDFDSEPEDEGDEDDEVEWENTDDEDTSSEEDEDASDKDSEDKDAASDDEHEAPKPKKPLTDNTTTVFVRNLPYTTTDEELKTHFSHFGPIRYARVVMNHSTEQSAGTGFVCFFNAPELHACVRNAPKPTPVTASGSKIKKSLLQDESSDPSGLYTLDGRILQVAAAVSKEEATKLSEDGPDILHKRKQDKRRLYLLNEGNIPHNSSLYATFSPSDIKMREASLTQRKKIVQSNPLLHISLARLALRNIPSDVTSKDLKALAREAVVGFASDVRAGLREPLSKEEEYRGGEDDREEERRRKEKGKGVVRQAKIIFEDKKGSKMSEQKTGANNGSKNSGKDDDDGGIAVGKSRGYGFIEYSSHRWALMGLRWLNGRLVGGNGGKGGGKGKKLRLIAEFAIENAQVVQRRKEMQVKSRLISAQQLEKQKAAGTAGTAGTAGGKSVAVNGKPFGKGKDAGRDRKGKGKGMEARSGGSSKHDEVEVEDIKAGKKTQEVKRKIISRTKMMRKKKEKIRRAGA
ncbi:uncharacterized protein MKZ38_008469 [Zalerion maritima]|uniref:RRM domain-containing protein n=1 Tax=Zalerion maritima TaxID=339359 RepID=A0AAD5WV51_9PEZI|nr:uncharacterized protein MKZ38_008469 [Zalerion maritima]